MRSIEYEPEEKEDVVRVIPASANANATGDCRRKITLRKIFKCWMAITIVAAMIFFVLFGSYKVKMSDARKDLRRASFAATCGYTEEALQYFGTALDKGREAYHVEKKALTVMKVTPLFPIAILIDRGVDKELVNIDSCEEEARRLFPDIDF